MLKIKGIPELQAAARAFAQAEPSTRKAVAEGAKAFGPELVKDAERRASALGPIERAVAGTGRVSATTKGLRATFGSSGAFHGEPLRNLARPFEWGGPREKYETYLSRQRVSRRAMQVKRRTQRQIPSRSPKGRYTAPAVEALTPKLAAAWADLIAREVLHGRQ